MSPDNYCATATAVQHNPKSRSGAYHRLSALRDRLSSIFTRNMQRSVIAMRSGEDCRQLRAITILTFPLGLGLIIPYAVITGLAFPAVGITPMLFSTVLGSLMYGGLLRSPVKRAIIDIALTIVYFALLIPR